MIKKENRRISIVVSQNIDELLQHIAENESRSKAKVTQQLMTIGLGIYLQQLKKEEQKHDVN